MLPRFTGQRAFNGVPTYLHKNIYLNQTNQVGGFPCNTSGPQTNYLMRDIVLIINLG